MAVHELTLASLMEKLDGGRVAMAFQAELKRCIADCDDRPGDDKDRKVVIELKLNPITDEQGHLQEVKGKFHIKSSVPNRRSKPYSFGLRRSKAGPSLVFNDLSDDNVNQATLPIEEE